MLKLLDASKLDLVATSTNHHLLQQMPTSSHGNVDLPALQLLGRSVETIVGALIPVTKLLPTVLRHLGLEIVLEEVTAMVKEITMVVAKTIKLRLQMLLHGNNLLQLIPLPKQPLDMLDMLLLVTLVDILLSKRWVPHLDWPLLLD